MEIKIFNLKLKNFKGIKELEVVFNGQNTNIYGKNATGKTTIFDAFKWLFFDKDSNDKKDFNIKTLDQNNKPIHFLEHEVEATLLIDGQDMTFKKVFQEKWVKKRGQSEQEFSGHETNYWIDEVPVKKKDYEEKINSLIPESLFKLITDPSYFNNQLKWTERRELLINISGANISDEEILDSKEEFSSIRKNIEGRSIDDYKKVVQAKIKELNKQKESIPVRIDELTNTLITEHNIDYEKIEKEKEELNSQLKTTELEMTDVQARAKENIEKADKLAKAKNELNELKITLEKENKQQYVAEKIKLINDKALNESMLRNKRQELDERQLKIEQDSKRKNELYKKWDEISNTKLEFDPDSFVCPTCKREYETEKIEEIKKQFENNFNNHKKVEQNAINTEGQAINLRIKENTETIEKIKMEMADIDKKLNEIKIKTENIENEEAKNAIIDVTTFPKYQEKLKEVNELQEIVDKLISSDTSEVQDRKNNIISLINNIDKQLNERTVQERTKERIKELENEEENIANKVQELEAQQYQIEQFTKTKVELLENAINSKFEVVKFRLFDTQINGGLVECCDTLVNGVPYSDVNNAHKILAGLDIINTLIKFYKTSAPIFIDNRESINELYNINAQVISLIVTQDEKLRIEVI